MELNKELKKYRKETLQISQDEASRRLHMTQPSLSNYEQGKRQISLDTLRDFQQAYAIPEDYLMKIIFGGKTGNDYSPMMLREHSKDADMQRIIQMLEKQPALFHFLVSLSYSSEKIQKELGEFLPHLLKLTESR